MVLANYLEDTYQRYRDLRRIASSVYPKKITKGLSFEEICTVVAFEFDKNNQSKVADALDQQPERMVLELCALATGARLEKQGK